MTNTLFYRAACYKKSCLAIFFLACIAAGAIAHKAFQPDKKPLFIPVRTIQELQYYTLRAEKTHQPLMVDFYADWCTTCKAIDTTIFNNATVQHSMQDQINLRVDISQPGAATNALQQQLGVSGVPTILFYHASGKPMPELTATGHIDTQHFLALLHQLRYGNIK